MRSHSRIAEHTPDKKIVRAAHIALELPEQDTDLPEADLRKIRAIKGEFIDLLAQHRNNLQAMGSDITFLSVRKKEFDITREELKQAYRFAGCSDECAEKRYNDFVQALQKAFVTAIRQAERSQLPAL